MDYNKKIKLWFSSLLIMLIIAGATATLLTQKYQLFKGDFSGNFSLGGGDDDGRILFQQYQLQSTEPSISLDTNTMLSIPRTGTNNSILTVCGNRTDEQSCNNNIDCQWLPGSTKLGSYDGEKLPGECLSNPVLYMEYDYRFSENTVPRGGSGIIGSYIFYNYSKDDINLTKLQLNYDGSHETLSNLKNNKLLVNAPDLNADNATLQTYARPTIGTVFNSEIAKTITWEGMSNITLAADRATKISVLATIDTPAKINEKFKLILYDKSRFSVNPQMQISSYAEFPMESSQITVGAGNVAPAKPTLTAQPSTINTLTPKLVWSKGADDGLARNYPTFRWYIKDVATGQKVWERPYMSIAGNPADALQNCPQHKNASNEYDWTCPYATVPANKLKWDTSYVWAVEQGDGDLDSGYTAESQFKTGVAPANVTLALDSNSPKDSVAWQSNKFVTIGKFKVAASTDTVINKIILNEKSISSTDTLKLEDIKTIRLRKSADGTETSAQELVSQTFFNTANRSAPFDLAAAQKAWTISTPSTQYFFVDIELKDTVNLGSGKKFAIGLKVATDITMTKTFAQTQTFPVWSNEVTVSPSTTTVTMAPTTDNPPSRDVKVTEDQFAVLKFSAVTNKGTAKVSINFDSLNNTFGTAGLPIEDIENLQLFDENGAILSPKTIYNSQNRYSLAALFDITSVKKNFVLKAKLKSSAADGKKFAFGFYSWQAQSTDGGTVTGSGLTSLKTNTFTVSNLTAPSTSKAKLDVEVKPVPSQSLTVSATNQIIKLAQINSNQTAAQISKIFLLNKGTLSTQKITKVQLYSTEGKEITAGTATTDKLTSITKNPTTGDIEIGFKTLQDANAIDALPTRSESYILYLTISPNNSDAEKSIKYSIQEVTAKPATISISRAQIDTPSVLIYSQAVYNPPVITKPPVIAPPPIQASCESKGQFTYTGPEKKGIRTPGMCINCATDIYLKNGGTCPMKEVSTKRRLGSIDVPQLYETASASSSTSTIDQNAASAASNTSAASNSAGNTVSALSYRAAAPDLYGSQRLVSAPDRGNTGPGIAIYLVAIGAANVGLWIKRKIKKN